MVSNKSPHPRLDQPSCPSGPQRRMNLYIGLWSQIFYFENIWRKCLIPHSAMNLSRANTKANQNFHLSDFSTHKLKTISEFSEEWLEQKWKMKLSPRFFLILFFSLSLFHSHPYINELWYVIKSRNKKKQMPHRKKVAIILWKDTKSFVVIIAFYKCLFLGKLVSIFDAWKRCNVLNEQSFGSDCCEQKNISFSSHSWLFFKHILLVEISHPAVENENGLNWLSYTYTEN